MSPTISCTFALIGSTGLSITLLAMAMPRHYAVLMKTSARTLRTSALRFTGWFMLLASLLIALTHWNGGFNLVFWSTLLGCHSFAAALLITYAGRLFRLMMAAAATSLVAGLLGLFVSI